MAAGPHAEDEGGAVAFTQQPGLYPERNGSGPEGRLAGETGFKPPPDGWWFAISAKVEGLVENVERLRTDVVATRSDFRLEIRGVIERHERDTQRELERLEKLLEKKAEKADVDPIRNNIRTVVMAILLTVVMAVVGLVIVNKPPVPTSVMGK